MSNASDQSFKKSAPALTRPNADFLIDTNYGYMNKRMIMFLAAEWPVFNLWIDPYFVIFPAGRSKAGNGI